MVAMVDCPVAVAALGRNHRGEIPAAVSAKYGPYFSWFVQGIRAEGVHLLIATVTRNVVSSLAIIRALFAPAGGAWLAILLLGAPGVAAAWRLARRTPVVFIAVAAHAAIILMWPFEPQRFIWTSWPFVVLWLCAGAAELWDQAHRVSSDPVESGATVRGCRLRTSRSRGRWNHRIHALDRGISGDRARPSKADQPDRRMGCATHAARNVGGER